MSSFICLRCFRRALVPVDSTLRSDVTSRAAFSSSSSVSANPPKRKAVVAKPSSRQGTSLRLAKNTRVSTARPPAPGERKAVRKRVVLSNTNALEVPGLRDWTGEVADAEALRVWQGRVLGFGNDTVDALRALEAFKPNQGWSLFRRPASLIRKETVELAEVLQGAQSEKTTSRRVLFGERGSGKSVLMLQAMATAFLRGWLVIHFPDAKDMTIAHTSYRPIQTSDGRTVYVQPHYTAHLLSNIARANRGILSNLRLSQQHHLPVPVQPNMSLARFAELGAGDPELAWPVWQGLLSELTTQPKTDEQGMQRPPLFVSMDGVDHIMRPSAYLDTEARPIHAHDVALVRSFNALLTGKLPLPNGGMVMAAISESNRAKSPTLDYYCALKNIERYSVPLTLRDRVREQVKAGQMDINTLDVFGTTPDPAVHPLAKLYIDFRLQILDLFYSDAPMGRYVVACANLDRKLQRHLPSWNPYDPMDARVADVMDNVEVQKVTGLTKDEARGIMEYYAQSGMLRAAVTDGLVSEKWTLAGNGVIGEIEKASVGLRF